MSSDVNSRIARHLGLSVPMCAELRALIASGEFPTYIRCAHPGFAKAFPSPFGFKILLERLRRAETFERRRSNLIDSLQEGSLAKESYMTLKETMSDAALECFSIAISPLSPPDGYKDPDKESLAEFVGKLRSNVELALSFVDSFEKYGSYSVKKGKKFDGSLPWADDFICEEQLISDIDFSKYLQLRRAERGHQVSVEFSLPASKIQELFNSCRDVLPQEKETYKGLFFDFIKLELLPRSVSQLRAYLKRRAEALSLQSGWEQCERMLDRGKQPHYTLGLVAKDETVAVLALFSNNSNTPIVAEINIDDEDCSEKISSFLGEHKVSLLSVQSDTKSRSLSKKLVKILPLEGVKVVAFPLSVVKTLVREVARRPEEALMGHDTRQAYLLARLSANPRDMAFHAPHIVRAFVPHRGEINSRMLEDFEQAFLCALVASHGLDVNQASIDALRVVPGLRARDVLLERVTGTFDSLLDLSERVAFTPQQERAAFCVLRVYGGSEPLDSLRIHPDYYAVVKQAIGNADFNLDELLKSHNLFDKLCFDKSFGENSNRKGIISRIRNGLLRSKSKRPQFRRGGRSVKGQKLETLRLGTMFSGIVKSVEEYGVFVEFGAEREGLIHVSQCSSKFIKHPQEILQEGQEIEARLIGVDLAARKIRLSLLTEEEENARDNKRSSFRNKKKNKGQKRRGERLNKRVEKKEEIDPTNPFYQFFQDNEVS
jgi:transcriptional accessory protein Tex/SPT6